MLPYRLLPLTSSTQVPKNALLHKRGKLWRGPSCPIRRQLSGVASEIMCVISAGVNEAIEAVSWYGLLSCFQTSNCAGLYIFNRQSFLGLTKFIKSSAIAASKTCRLPPSSTFFLTAFLPL